MALAHRGEQVHAAHLGHALVGHHHLAGVLCQQAQGLLRPRGAEHLKGLVAQQALDGLEDIDLVVDEQDRVLQNTSPGADPASDALFLIKRRASFWVWITPAISDSWGGRGLSPRHPGDPRFGIAAGSGAEAPRQLADGLRCGRGPPGGQPAG